MEPPHGALLLTVTPHHPPVLPRGPPRGGTSFRVVVDGGAVEMCCVRDEGGGRYSVTCPRRALDSDGCGQISIELGFERYGAFYNHEQVRVTAAPTPDFLLYVTAQCL